jgi:hypothetical protein
MPTCLSLFLQSQRECTDVRFSGCEPARKRRCRGFNHSIQGARLCALRRRGCGQIEHALGRCDKDVIDLEAMSAPKRRIANQHGRYFIWLWQLVPRSAICCVKQCRAKPLYQTVQPMRMTVIQATLIGIVIGGND